MSSTASRSTSRQSNPRSTLWPSTNTSPAVSTSPTSSGRADFRPLRPIGIEDFAPGRPPDPVVSGDVREHFGEGADTARLAGHVRMDRDAHHPPAFGVERVERSADHLAPVGEAENWRY